MNGDMILVAGRLERDVLRLPSLFLSHRCQKWSEALMRSSFYDRSMVRSGALRLTPYTQDWLAPHTHTYTHTCKQSISGPNHGNNMTPTYENLRLIPFLQVSTTAASHERGNPFADKIHHAYPVLSAFKYLHSVTAD